MEPSELDADNVETFTDVRAFMAALVLLKDEGHCENVEFGEDEDSQQFVADVREQNPDWTPGQPPRVPPRRPELSRFRLSQRQPVIHVPAQQENATRPRERRARGSSTSSRGSPDDSEPEPPLRVVPLARFRRDVRLALEELDRDWLRAVELDGARDERRGIA